MNKRQIVASLNEIANQLESTGLYKEAIEITDLMVKLSQSMPPGFVKDDKTFPGMYFGPGKKQTPKLSPDVLREIDNLIVRASQITKTQATQFNDRGTGIKDENPGWDFIRQQAKRLSPEAYKELERQYALANENKDGWAKRKGPKKSTITPPGIINVDDNDVKRRAFELIHQTKENFPNDIWTNFNKALSQDPLFKNNRSGMEFAKKMLWYNLTSDGKNPSVKPNSEITPGP